jgi:neutral ceramidase
VLLPVRPSPSANVTWSIHTLTRRRYGGLYTERNIVISGIHTHSAPGGFLQYTLYDVASLGFVRETFDALVEGIVEVR